jgi:solute:Na+ symporter, SSS family
VTSLLTKPAPMDCLIGFYKRTGVWGFWGPVKRKVLESDPGFRSESEAHRDLSNVLLGMLLLIGLYLGPMYLIVHRFAQAAGCLAFAAMLSVVLFFVWYRHLPPPEIPAQSLAAEGDRQMQMPPVRWPE